MSAVDHPKHYNAFGPIEDDGTAQYEPIKVIEAWGMGPEFCIGNALKYIARAPHKGRPIEDLEKAKWYLERAGIISAKVNERSVIPSPSIALMDWSHVVAGWGLRGHLRNAILNIWNGCPTSAAEFVGKEIARLMEGAP